MIFTKLDAKLIFKPSTPTGEFRNWLIQNGLSPNKYTVVNEPIFIVYYMKRNDNELYSYNVSVESYRITPETISEIEMCNVIFIYPDDIDTKNNIIRVKPIICDNEYIRLMRYKKLKRVIEHGY